MKQKLVIAVLYFYWVLLRYTVRIKHVGIEKVDSDLALGKVPVFACPHCVFLPCVLAYDGRPLHLLASLSKDGELIARILEKRKITVSRGSSSRGGREALMELLDVLKARKSPVGITFDGPRGPALVPKRGIAICGRAATGSVYLVYVIPRPTWPFGKYFHVRLRSWDRFLLAFPFARFEMHYEELAVSVSKDDETAWENELLTRLEARAKEVYGHVYERP